MKVKIDTSGEGIDQEDSNSEILDLTVADHNIFTDIEHSSEERPINPPTLMLVSLLLTPYLLVHCQQVPI